ncbi:MAG: chromosome segregation protein SMC, partial [Clostridia bacterium]|nr:chromosome segregation protein SMC [Clostridia bacterium]
MYLKCLELHGFKSFPNRTVLTFEKGTTVIVGPNGSGKSNLSDAMRWVLGEISSKTLRGTKMEDVIFGGTNVRRPMGFAEVSVTFDNSDKDNRINFPYDEITVTRRYYRAGESEYMINKKPCRLRDITELFLNTGIGREGYSIVGQGRVAEIISRKSEDRRNIFEEAAGIAKYRLNKKESERKLAATEIDMNRLRDIVGVLEKRVGPLARDAEKAKKYLAVIEEKKAIDVSLWLYDTEKILDDLRKAEDRYKLSSKQLEIVTETIADLDRQLNDLEQEMTRNRIRSEELVNQIQAVRDRLNKLDNRYGVIQSDVTNLEERVRSANERIGSIKGQKGSLTSEKESEEEKRKSLEAALADTRKQKDETAAALQKVTEQLSAMDRKLEDMLTELNDVKGQAVDFRARIEVLQKAEDSAGSQDDTMLSEIKKYEESEEKLKAEVERCDLAASGFRSKIEETDRAIAELSQDVTDLESDRDEVKSKLNDAYVKQTSTLEKAKSLENLEMHFQGYGATVQFIMSEYEAGVMDFGKTYFGTIYGPLSQLISMDERYHIAIETALGGNVQNIVVDEDETAKAVIRHLQKNNAGRATFLAVSTIKAQSETDEVRQAANHPGYIDRADRVVKCDDKFREIVGWYLSRTVVFDTLEHALACSHALRSRIRIVTLDGQIINAGGAITGGSVKTSGILSRSSEIEKLKSDAKEQGKQIRKLEEELADIETDLTAKRQELKDHEQNKELLLTMSRTQFADLDRANANLEANGRLLERLRSDLETLRTSREESVKERRNLQENLTEAEEKAERLTRERNAYHIERNAVDDKKNDLTEEINRLNLSIAETAKDIESVDQMLRSLSERDKSADSDIQSFVK